MPENLTSEAARLADYHEGYHPWRRWGTYLSERAWGSVREDYSATGEAWDYFSHDQSRSRAYRWNEDGLLGWCDEQGQICFALTLWNGHDPILKERAFGLTNSEGNHGEDLKELYYFLEGTPTHSYSKGLYKYPHAAFPYANLVDENRRRGRLAPEYELIDTGVFHEDRYFDVFVEYAKAGPDDTLIRFTLVNRGPEPAHLDLLPTLWFRNIWSWREKPTHPTLCTENVNGHDTVKVAHSIVGDFRLWFDAGAELLFTGNDTNSQRLYGAPNPTPYVKDGINDYVVQGRHQAVNPEKKGTKAAVRYQLTLGAGETKVVKLRLSPLDQAAESAWDSDFDAIFAARIREADEFYAPLAPAGASDDARLVQRQALAGLLWSKQFYCYDVRRWIIGDPTEPTPPEVRWQGRNHDWTHLNSHDVLAMPDTWEYPWFAAWDMAFHCLTFSIIDSEFAKHQLLILLRTWYLHPNGQLPAYEWAFGDVNPPVHAWAALRIFRIERKRTGVADWNFLERIFHKLLLNFTWWVNRKDASGRNVFQGGFLGLDNIGVFDRSAPMPGGGHLDQSDGTAWMAMFCLNMLSIALELAGNNIAYEDMAGKFLEHFFFIASAMNNRPGMRGSDPTNTEGDLWDDQDGFYYDVLHIDGRAPIYIKVRSLVGLIPLLAVDTLSPELLEKLPVFASRLEWFLAHRPDLTDHAASVKETGIGKRRLFAVVDEERLRSLLHYALNESEFLSDYGLRSISAYHKDHPYSLSIDGKSYDVSYQPGESLTGLFGGNSNWRGPIWFPLNYLLIEALQKFDFYYGPSFTVECPVGSGKQLTLWEVAQELSARLTGVFTRGQDGRRPVLGFYEKFQSDPEFKDYVPFHEYFHGDTGMGLGATHQTGWTALVAKLIQQSYTKSATVESTE